MRRALAWVMAANVAAGLAGAHAGGLDIRIVDRSGKPIADAVVTVNGGGGGAATANAPSKTRRVDQKNLAFIPHVEVFHRGDAVVFRNSDQTRHHVYSFSKAKAFEFVVPPGQASSAMTLDRAGVVAVGCNIHDDMVNYLYVSDAPWIARSDADGRVRFDDLAAGSFEVRAWHPQLAADLPGRPTRLRLRADEMRALTLPLGVVPEPKPRASDREQTGY